jgi:putative ABC transport system permease protein
MFAYYFQLAVRSLRRSPVMTALMVLTIAVGVASSVTSLTVLRILSGDPLPDRSDRLYFVQLESRQKSDRGSSTEPPTVLDYVDARKLMDVHRADRQAMMVAGIATILPDDPDQQGFVADGWFTSADFFPMFNPPLRYGSAWNAQDDADAARVAVISSTLNDKLFKGGNSVGRMLTIGDTQFRVIGVLAPWKMEPEVYTVPVGGSGYRDMTEVYVPFAAARSAQLALSGHVSCYEDDPGEARYEQSSCLWLTLWVELDTPAKAAAYRDYLIDYSNQQRASGRYQWPPDVRLRNVMQLLDALHVVPQDVRLQTWLAFGFLAVCVLNTVGLLLAKFLRRSGEIGVRRALGASRGNVFAQFLTEAGVVGLAGGVLGLVLTFFCLWWMQHRPQSYAALIHPDLSTVMLSFVIAVLASLMAGLLPAWRACGVTPALQLKGG